VLSRTLTGLVAAMLVTRHRRALARPVKEDPMTPVPVVRVSISRCDAGDYDKLHRMMLETEAVLRPGIERMPGFLAFYSGEDRENLAFSNISLWDTPEHARQLDHFQPMLEAGKRFAAAGARFDRPVTNFATLWQFGSAAGPAAD
jgi:hypothetical protein